jgi:hypothetical protein
LADSGQPASRFTEDVRADVIRGASVPDYFSTRPTAELQEILREAQTQPLEKVVNTGAVRIDFAADRIYRDSFWKGSFARDTLLGWEERIRRSILGDLGIKTASVFTGGSFWKRFDVVSNGVAQGYVVNYGLTFLPGLPAVREVAYPDDKRRYFRKGDSIMLLNYTNQPYKMVYDTFKIIDDENAIGVVHLGEFPNGVEVVTFIMARNNYPFENMSVEDFDLVFSDPHTAVPTAQDLEGAWKGHLIFVTDPDNTLANQFNPVAFELDFHVAGVQVEARYRFGLVGDKSNVQMTDEFVRLSGPMGFQDEIRMIDADRLIARWVATDMASDLADRLHSYIVHGDKGPVLHFVLSRA